MKKMGIRVFLAATLAAGICLLPLTARYAEAQAQPKPVLSNEDCAKCHDQQPQDIMKDGASHKEEISCQDCHENHRPSSEKNIPSCSDCHDGESHFELKDCLSCHTNPHTPLKITIAKGITDPCLTCHDSQIAQLTENKSKHTAQACSNCHDIHGKIPECVSCHKPHAETMTQADCGKCHQAHMPTVVTYDEKTTNKDCSACHGKAFDLLAASKAKHQTKACVFCHKQKHKTIPTCDSCHGAPHPESLMKKFPKCGDCHYIAHDLNNWPVQPNKAAPTKKN